MFRPLEAIIRSRSRYPKVGEEFGWHFSATQTLCNSCLVCNLNSYIYCCARRSHTLIQYTYLCVALCGFCLAGRLLSPPSGTLMRASSLCVCGLLRQARGLCNKVGG